MPCKWIDLFFTVKFCSQGVWGVCFLTQYPSILLLHSTAPSPLGIFIPSSEMPFFCLNDSTFFSFYLAQKENFFSPFPSVFGGLSDTLHSFSLSLFFFFWFLVTMLSAHLKNKCIIKIIQNKCMLENNNGFDPWVGKIPWRREWLPPPVFLPGEFHGQRSLMGYCPWGCKETDMTERLTLKIIKG